MSDAAATLELAGFDDSTSTSAGHALQEAVDSRAVLNFGLVGPFRHLLVLRYLLIFPTN